MPVNLHDHNPSSLEETITILASNLSAEEREVIAQEDASYFHNGVGRTIRNEWKLWDYSSPFAMYFAETYQIVHADDMSGMILQGLRAYVRSEEFYPDAVAAVYRDFWEEK